MNTTNRQDAGFVLQGKYKITRQTDEQGESVVYSGVMFDTGKKIIVHEYLPQNLAVKDLSTGEVVCNPGCEVMFKSLLEDFIELGNLLIEISKIGRYAVVECYDMLRQNNTVYMVFDDPASATFEDFLARLNGSIGWTTLKRMLTPVIYALSALHAKGYYHRGISPCNLMLTPNQTLKLTGFCIPAARTAQSEIPSTLYFGYSAPEQHTLSSWQGGWTDVYGIAATCYRALTGVSVVDCRQRKTQPKLVSPADYNSDVPLYVSDAIMKALSLNPKERHSSIEEFWRDITNDEGTTVAFSSILPFEQATGRSKTLKPANWVTYLFLSAIVIGGAFISYNAIVNPGYFSKPGVSSSSSDADQDSSDSQPPIAQELLPNFTDKYIETILDTDKYTDNYNFTIEWRYTENCPYGTVISQLPLQDTAPTSREVKLLVSKGSEFTTMPNIIGKEETMVVEMLTALDIKFELLEIIDIQSPAQTIISASAEFGDTVSKLSDVVRIYSARNY